MNTSNKKIFLISLLIAFPIAKYFQENFFPGTGMGLAIALTTTWFVILCLIEVLKHLRKQKKDKVE